MITPRQILHKYKCSRCIFLTEEMAFLDTFCPNCFFVEVPKNSTDDKKQKALGLLYQKRDYIIKNINALTPKMDTQGYILQFLQDALKRCDLKIEETTNN